jgi:hypothetical protein
MRQQTVDNVWPFLKSPIWNQVEGNGNYQTAGIKMPIGVDNSFQHRGIDPTKTLLNGAVDPSGGNVVNTFQDCDIAGRTLLNNPNGTATGGFVAAPAAPTVVANTVGAVTWSYAIVYRFASGVTTTASPNGSTTTGVAALSASIVNTISGVAPDGVAYVDIYRTVAGTTPSTTGYIASIICNTLTPTGAWSYQDIGVAGDGSSPPTVNTTGLMKIRAAQDIQIVALQPSALVTVANVGTAGSSQYSYAVAALTEAGTFVVSATATTNTGNAALSVTNYNTITWRAVPGAISYQIYRVLSTGTPSTTGLIGTVAGSLPPAFSYSFADTGIAIISAAFPGPGFNNTGSLVEGSAADTYQSVTLSAAQIYAMNGAPVVILPAPEGPNQAILVNKILVEVLAGATAFTTGGAVSFVYHGGAVNVVTGTVPAATVNGVANSKSYTLLGPAVVATGTVVPANTGVDITNAGSAFAAGNGTMIVQIWYDVVNL